VLRQNKRAMAAIAVMMTMTLLMQTAPVLAQAYDPLDDLPKPTVFEKTLTKVGRGLSNIMFGWAEIPLTFDTKLKQGKGLAYLLGVVPVLGTGKAIMRTGVGIYEVFTFPYTKEGQNFEAILEPEYIF
jgi:putative exosortase-associated protein (TIGR04073 family)